MQKLPLFSCILVRNEGNNRSAYRKVKIISIAQDGGLSDRMAASASQSQPSSTNPHHCQENPHHIMRILTTIMMILTPSCLHASLCLFLMSVFDDDRSLVD
jgi:hypothetical protein